MGLVLYRKIKHNRDILRAQQRTANIQLVGNTTIGNIIRV